MKSVPRCGRRRRNPASQWTPIEVSYFWSQQGPPASGWGVATSWRSPTPKFRAAGPGGRYIFMVKGGQDMTGEPTGPGLVPLQEQFFEDYVPGMVGVFGAEPVSEAEILDFAARFDPQGIHTDAAAAARGPFEGLIASGRHTMALMMRILVRYYLNEAASLASPGVDELRWLKPVRPGDVLSLRCTVVQAQPSRSKPDRGLVHTAVEILNQDRETVATLTMMNLLRRRPGHATGVFVAGE